jgi:glycosyltransferase involved in cell wall biosynthesis
MKIGVFPADFAGCGHYRLIWPALALQDEGHDVTIVPPDKRDGMFKAEIENGQVTRVMAPQYDVMIFQRVTHKYLAQAVKLLRERGTAVVIDIDDDLETIHPSNPAWSLLHPRNTSSDAVASHSWEWARVACDSATMVTVSSYALLRRYARYGHGVVIRNYVPEEYLTIPHASSPVIGWGGSLHSHPNDVPKLGHSIAQLMEDGFDFRVIGPGIGIREVLHLSSEPVATGPVDLEGWPIALAQLGIGVAPLDWETRFNAAKSWLKPLEYAAVGVVPVMSPGVEYREIHKLGIGMIAEKTSAWVKKIQRLAMDESFREDQALRMRSIVAEKLTIQRNVHRWGEAWAKAFDIEQAMARSRPRTPIPPGSAFGITTR